MSDIEVHHPSLHLANTEQAGWGVSQNYPRYISRSLASLPQVQLRSCTITFTGEPDEVRISFYYKFSSAIFKKVVSCKTYKKIDETSCL